MSSSTTTIGQRVKQAREAAGLSQRALAEKSGVSQQTVAALELGTRPNPTVGNLQRLASALGVGVGRLLGEGEE